MAVDRQLDLTRERSFLGGNYESSLLGNSTSKEASKPSSAGFYIEGGARGNYDVHGLPKTGKLHRVDDEAMLEEGLSAQDVADEFGAPFDPWSKNMVEGYRLDRVVRAERKIEPRKGSVDVLASGMEASRVPVGIDLSRIEDHETMLTIASAGGVELIRSLWLDPSATVEIRAGNKKRSPTVTLRGDDAYVTLTVGNWERVLGTDESKVKLPTTKGDVYDVAGNWAIAMKSLDIPDENGHPRKLLAGSIGVYRGEERVA